MIAACSRAAWPHAIEQSRGARFSADRPREADLGLTASSRLGSVRVRCRLMARSCISCPEVQRSNARNCSRPRERALDRFGDLAGPGRDLMDGKPSTYLSTSTCRRSTAVPAKRLARRRLFQMLDDVVRHDRAVQCRNRGFRAGCRGMSARARVPPVERNPASGRFRTATSAVLPVSDRTARCGRSESSQVSWNTSAAVCGSPRQQAKTRTRTTHGPALRRTRPTLAASRSCSDSCRLSLASSAVLQSGGPVCVDRLTVYMRGRKESFGPISS